MCPKLKTNSRSSMAYKQAHWKFFNCWIWICSESLSQVEGVNLKFGWIAGSKLVDGRETPRVQLKETQNLSRNALMTKLITRIAISNSPEQSRDLTVCVRGSFKLMRVRILKGEQSFLFKLANYKRINVAYCWFTLECKDLHFCLIRSFVLVASSSFPEN